MPKDEFDFDDPMELSGVALLTEDDTTDVMAECFIEEFMRLGHDPKQILALFRNPHYQGPHLAWRRRGEPFVRNLVDAVFARWGKAATWTHSCSSRREEARTSVPAAASADTQSLRPPAATTECDPTLTDPMGGPLPDVTV